MFVFNITQLERWNQGVNSGLSDASVSAILECQGIPHPLTMLKLMLRP